MSDSAQFAGLIGPARRFFQRHWRRALLLRDRLRFSEETTHLFLALIVGVLGAAVRLTYSLLNQWSLHHLAQGLRLQPVNDLMEMAAQMPAWQLVLLPAAGGLIAGLLLVLGLRLIGNPGLSNLLEVVVAGDGRLRFRPALLNALSSLISLNTGASIGREGLIIQLTAAMASRLGQFARWPPYRLRLLVACGAAAGIAAGCNAPIAGAVFAAQIVLGNFSMHVFAPLVVSSVVAAVLPRPFLSADHWFDAPLFDFDFTRLTQLPWFLLLGVAAGTGGALFQKALRGAEHCFARVPLPLYGRIALAGLGVGLLALVYPEVLGNGYEATNRLIRTAPVLEFAAGLLVAKFLATTLMVGSGTPGGVFTPTLFLGAALGGLFEAFLKLAGAGDALPTGCFTLAGMAAMLAATTHSPLLAMIMSFELTLNYSLMPAVMVACVVATLMSRRLHPESIYTEPLRRKGLELDRETTRPGAATERSVADLMRAPIEPLLENTPFRTIADRFLVSPNNFLPVVDGDARLLGVVALHDLKEWLNAAQDFNGIIASDVMRPPPACLTPNQRLLDALPVLLASEMRNVPVVNNLQQFRLIGSLARAEALNLVSDAITARAAARV